MSALTENNNAIMIRKLMATQAMHGNPKNFVVIVGNQLIDTSGTFKGFLSEGGRVVGDSVLLVHKKDLAKIIGKKAALRFWHPDLGLVEDVLVGGSTVEPDPEGEGEADA
ncbi:hypothetical protein LCGC14_0460360 [marine sediment metagenome]|uniref:Uncharacterized protein n=1 Tax=marine sediment metagenome TaxID=412755 RepID=A0A0F9V239_9ZZZZ